MLFEAFGRTDNREISVPHSSVPICIHIHTYIYIDNLILFPNRESGYIKKHAHNHRSHHTCARTHNRNSSPPVSTTIGGGGSVVDPTARGRRGSGGRADLRIWPPRARQKRRRRKSRRGEGTRRGAAGQIEVEDGRCRLSRERYHRTGQAEGDRLLAEAYPSAVSRAKAVEARIEAGSGRAD